MGEPMVHHYWKDKEMTKENTIPNGTLVEVTKDGDEAQRGQQFYVEDYAPYNEDPDYYSEIYTGSDKYGSWVAAHKDDVKVLMTAEQVRNRKLPNAKTILGKIDFLGGFSDFRFTQSDITSPDTIELLGETPEGLNFAVELKVINIYEADL